MATTTEKTRVDVVESYVRLPYSRVLVPEPEGGYSAEILEFPGCVSDGETAQEAIHNLEEAARSWIEAALEAGQKIPPPADDDDYSGKFALRLLRGMHRKAAQFAERQGVSLNTFFVEAIAHRLGMEDYHVRLIERLEARLKEANQQTETARVQFYDQIMSMIAFERSSVATTSAREDFLGAPYWQPTQKSNRAGAG